jgi:hypothetical protein
VDVTSTNELRAGLTRSTEWIDRGAPVASPPPGDFRVLHEEPIPWLVVRRSSATEVLARADD